MRIGIFGGTFDPVHLGHLVTAEQCREQAQLDQVWFVPAARPPHKQGQSVTSFGQRVEMLALAVAGHPVFRVNELEKDRPGASYTVDTLAELQRLRPEDELSLLIGSDCLPDLPSWREPVRILQLAQLLVATRPNWPLWPLEQLRAALQVPNDFVIRCQLIQLPQIDLASRDLRQRVAQGRSLRYLVPRAVECFIREKQIYKSEPLT